MLDVLRFWLDRGVDGFRIDALRQVIKDPQLRDNPPNPDCRDGQTESDTRCCRVHSADQPTSARRVAAMRERSPTSTTRVMIGELYLPLERLVPLLRHAGGCTCRRTST